MTPRYREMTAKYKALRLQPSTLFLSRITQTFFNKFIKKGKKALARRHIYKALIRFRFNLRRPTMHQALLRLFRSLRTQFIIVYRRKGRKILEVPVPVRRNKSDTFGPQLVYAAIGRRQNREFHHRASDELFSNILQPGTSSPHRFKSSQYSKMYDERVHIEYR